MDGWDAAAGWLEYLRPSGGGGVTGQVGRVLSHVCSAFLANNDKPEAYKKVPFACC